MKFLKFHEKSEVGHLQLSRPEVKNAFHPELIQELVQFFSQPVKSRLVVLSGEGSVFSAGADLKWMQSLKGASPEQNKKDAQKLKDLFLAVQNFSKPLICSVQGGVFGGALGLVALSDWVVAEERTQFCFSEVLLGIAPAVVSEFVLSKCALAQVAPWMLSGKVFSSEQAHSMGLVQTVSSTENHQDHVDAMVQQFLRVGPHAFAATKKLLRNFETEKKTTVELIASLRTSDEGQEGLMSFLEKRKANWVPK